jgi:glutathione S-transferase
MTYTLYAADVSLFSGKARAYLRWKGMDFVEVAPTADIMKSVLLPTIGWPVIPVLGLPDGTLIQDTGDIIAHIEATHPGPSVYPDGPVQRFVTELLHTYADQWLTLPAMHYRWNHNEAWVLEEFGRLAAPDADRETQIAIGTKRGAMFRAMVPALGVTPETAPAIEASYLAFLDGLNTLLQRYNFLFGGRPTLADFALYGPLYAHLYRDPASGAIMKEHAPHVAAWVERLRSGDYTETALVKEDWILEVLLPLLRRHHREHLPVLQATNNLLAKVSGDTLPRVLGMVPFSVEGVEGQTIARPFSLFRLQAALDIYSEMSADDRARADTLLDATQGAALRTFVLSKRLARRDYKLCLA